MHRLLGSQRVTTVRQFSSSSSSTTPHSHPKHGPMLQIKFQPQTFHTPFQRAHGQITLSALLRLTKSVHHLHHLTANHVQLCRMFHSKIPIMLKERERNPTILLLNGLQCPKSITMHHSFIIACHGSAMFQVMTGASKIFMIGS